MAQLSWRLGMSAHEVTKGYLGLKPVANLSFDDAKVQVKMIAEDRRLERSRGFRRKEINRVRELVVEHRDQLLESWNEFFRG